MRVGKLLGENPLVENNKVQNHQGSKASQLAEVPGDNDLSFFLEGSSISLLLPVSADGRRRSTGVGADEISRSDGSGEIGTLGQVLTLLTTSEDAGVSSRCSCRPAGDALATFEIERKRPAGVDSCDSLHGNLEGSNHVLDYNFVFTHLNSRKPKEHQGAKDNGQHQWSAQKHSRHAIGSKDAGQGQRHGNNDGNREVSRGLSNENLHVTSVAVNEKGLCLNDL
jgi:hypothetical protein